MKINKWIFLSAMVLCLALVVVGTVFTVRDCTQQRKDKEVFEQLSVFIPEVVVSETDLGSSGGTVSSGDVAPAEKPTIYSGNPECIGWLSIEGTNLSYPVMHTPDEPTKYLNRNYYGDYSSAGVPFLDARCDLSNSDNLIFYGHRMKNGTMFSCLKKYTDKSFRDSHSTVTLQTEDGVFNFEVFAVVSTDKVDRWYCFTNAVSAAEYDSMIDYAIDHSLYDTGIRPAQGDRIISLSTCYGSGKDGRLIVIARELKQS